MTVEELIQALEKYPRDRRVYIDGLDGGVDDVERVKEVQVQRDASVVSYRGQHEADPIDPRGKHLEPGLLLG